MDPQPTEYESARNYLDRDASVDPFGSSISWEGGADSVELLKGKGGEWRTHRKVVKLSAGVMSADASLVAELSVPKPAIFQRSAQSIPLVFSIALQTPTTKGLFSKKSLKEVTVSKVSISIRRQQSSGTGDDLAPEIVEEVVRSESFAFGGGVETPSKQPGSLIIHANAGANVLEIEYELQSKSLMTDARDDTKRNARVSNLPPSFRTATAKLQYIFVAMISIEGHGDYFVTTFPIQFIEGNEAALPSIDAAIRKGKEEPLVTDVDPGSKGRKLAKGVGSVLMKAIGGYGSQQ